MRNLALFLLALFAVGCKSPHEKVQIGFDPNWYPINFGAQTAYVNGYTEDLLLTMAGYSGMEFELISANWDTLFKGLKEKKYDAVLCSLPPYIFNEALYAFSKNFLDTGPVLVVAVDAVKIDLKKMNGDVIGVIANDPAVLLIDKYPTIVTQSYSSIPELLDAVQSGAIEGAIVDRIFAIDYVSDLYAGKLKIVGEPLNRAGLHLVAPKEKKRLVDLFDNHLKSLMKQKKIERLQKKWGLQT